jgi:hypothetical protein
MSDKSFPLFASYEKIKRARSKFDYLKSAVNRYINLKPVSTRVERHADVSYVIATINEEVPIEIAWETVEAVGHLRSALDKMAIDLVIHNGRGVSGVGFPFGGVDNSGKPNPFPDARILASEVKKKLTPEQWTFVEAQKPYPGGNDPLWAVNEIANADKHRKGLVEVSASVKNLPFYIGLFVPKPTQVGQAFSASTTFTPHPTDCDSLLQDKEREFVVLSFSNPNTNNQVDCTATNIVAFGDISPVQGKNLLVTLNEQIRIVDGIVSMCKRKFFS